MPDRCSREHLRVPGLTFKILFVFTRSIAVQWIGGLECRVMRVSEGLYISKSVEVATDTDKRLWRAYCSGEHTR